MSSFANELSNKLSSHEVFWGLFEMLQSAGAVSTLPDGVDEEFDSLSENDIAKLLYCAGVFAQSDLEKFKSISQSIALSCMLISQEPLVLEKCSRILTELGNFPGLGYAEQHYGVGSESLIGTLQRRLAQEINTVQVGGQRLPLTDYQKNVWDQLAGTGSLAISAPTSAGKSFLVIEHMCRLASESSSFCAVYIAPTRALLSEVLQTVQVRLLGMENIRVSSVPSLDPEKNNKQVFVLTQERLQVLLAISDMSFDLVIVDEAQNLSDGSRGMILQECLEQVLQRSQITKIIMLAPGAEGFFETAKVIGLNDLRSLTTSVSPVQQNRIVVHKVRGKNELKLELLTGRRVLPLGQLATERGMDIPATRLAAVALELGSSGGSLVYSTGPSDAEDIALQISLARKNVEDIRLLELAEFIEKHIHPDYKLALQVRNGVAFHYGRMPSLLRESLEEGFKSGALKFLVCTTTLFQGVNLPARNVFIDTPTRGKGTSLDPALLWNFAGRAGRMRKDIVGNVFLVDYDEWPDKPMSEFVKFKIKPAIQETLTTSHFKVLDALSGNMPKRSRFDESSGKVTASAGLLIARAAKGDVNEFIARILPDVEKERVSSLVAAAIAAAESLQLPSVILTSNWMVDPFGQKRLYDKIVSKINADEFDDLIPINPHEPGASSLYGGIFHRILKSVYGQEGNFGGYVSSLAIPWMKGMPYPVILATAIKKEVKRIDKKTAEYFEKKTLDPKSRVRRPKALDSSQVIRKTFDLIEDVVRFQFVQLGKVYIDLLSLALRNEGYPELVSDIFDFSLALELGISTQSGRSYVELGLSRIAASALDQIYPNSKLTISEARAWLWDLDVQNLKVGRVILEEIQKLGLIRSEA